VSVLLPGSRREALELLARSNGAAMPIAGGTDLLVHWPQRQEEHDRAYLDLSGIAELRPVEWTPDALVLGGLTTYWDVIRDARVGRELPLLAVAARQVGSIQIQTRGTWAGNIVNGSPAADGVPVLMAYDAVVVLESVAGREEVPLERFYEGYKQMRRRPDQLVVAIRIPRRPYTFQRFVKIGSRRAQAIAKVGLAVTHSAAGGGGWRVVAASVAPTIRRCPSIERLLEEQAAVHSPEELLPAIARDVTPIDDIRSTAEYRKLAMARVLFYDVFRGREQGAGSTDHGRRMTDNG